MYIDIYREEIRVECTRMYCREVLVYTCSYRGADMFLKNKSLNYRDSLSPELRDQRPELHIAPRFRECKSLQRSTVTVL